MKVLPLCEESKSQSLKLIIKPKLLVGSAWSDSILVPRIGEFTGFCEYAMFEWIINEIARPKGIFLVFDTHYQINNNRWECHFHLTNQLKPLSAFLIFAYLIGKKCYLLVLICVSLIVELNISSCVYSTFLMTELSLCPLPVSRIGF